MMFSNGLDQSQALGIRVMLNFADSSLQDAPCSRRNAQGIDVGAEIAQSRRVPGQEPGGVIHVPAMAYMRFHNVAQTTASTMANPNEIHINSIARGT